MGAESDELIVRILQQFEEVVQRGYEEGRQRLVVERDIPEHLIDRLIEAIDSRGSINTGRVRKAITAEGSLIIREIPTVEAHEVAKLYFDRKIGAINNRLSGDWMLPMLGYGSTTIAYSPRTRYEADAARS